MNTTTAKKPPPRAIVELTASELTPNGAIYCPHPKAQMQRWDTHPRVFLNMLTGQADCPYCGTQYRLKAGEKPGPHP